MRAPLVALAVGLGACADRYPEPINGSPSYQHIEVTVDTLDGTPAISWSGGAAETVRVRNAEGRVVWLIQRSDDETGRLLPPIMYGAPWAESTIRPSDLVPGEVYWAAVSTRRPNSRLRHGEARVTVSRRVVPRHPLPSDVTVRQRDAGPIQILWSPPHAAHVTIRHRASGAVVWRADAGTTRYPMSSILRSPLSVTRFGMPTDVHLPDGRGPESTVPGPIVRGERYLVTVGTCEPGPALTCRRGETATAEFVAR